MPSSGRFQSHLLSSLSQQSLRWRDRIGRSLRRTKMVAVWTAQIVLYPIYVAFQSARVVGRQLRQVQTWPSRLLQRIRRSPTASTLPSADTPIRRVLKAAIAETILTPRSPNAGYGLATQLDTRELVLTALDQGIVAFFSAQQQYTLRQHIAWELADYWRTQRQLQPVPKPLPLPAERVAMFPPVRAFWRLMAWVQLSPVAIATNLFREAALVTDLENRGAIVPIPNIATGSEVDLATFLGQSTRKGHPLPDWMDPDYAVPRELRALQTTPSSAVSQASDETPSAAMTLSAALGGELAGRSRVVTSDLATTAALKAETEDMVYTPPWIETNATLVRYEMHPLERLLNWLDRGLFWLEKRFHALLSWVWHTPRS
jgi:hypothetical protein